MRSKRYFIILVQAIIASSLISCNGDRNIKEDILSKNIHRAISKEPLTVEADLNCDGLNERIVFEVGYENERISSMSILKIKVFSKGKLVYTHNLLSKYGDYHGDYFIQKFRYISSVTRDNYRDLIFIYAGCCPPELYILYCQPKQYTEGHKIIADEKYEILDTRIRLEEFQG